MQPDISNHFSGDLGDNEFILWSGQPARKVILSVMDFLYVPFTSFPAVVITGSMIEGIIRGDVSAASSLAILMLISPVLFLCVAGRFLIQLVQKHNTYYAVTNERVLIRTGVMRQIFQHTDLCDCPIVSHIKTPLNTGSIEVYRSKGKLPAWIDEGSAHPNWFARFNHIQDAGAVYDLICAIRKFYMENGVAPRDPGAVNRYMKSSAEIIVWQNTPVKDIFGSYALDLAGLPFTLVWGGVAYYFIGTAVVDTIAEKSYAFLIILLFVAIPVFGFFGFYLSIGRIIITRDILANTFYTATEFRLQEACNARWIRFHRSIFFDAIPKVTKTKNPDGTGRIEFGELTSLYKDIAFIRKINRVEEAHAILTQVVNNAQKAVIPADQ